MLYLFDLDDTLISGSISSRSGKFTDWHLLLGRRDMLQALNREGHDLGIITNQAGVAFPSFGITEEDVWAKIEATLALLDLPRRPFVAVCFAHPKSPRTTYKRPEELARRKPSGAMIREAMASLGYPQGVSITDPRATFYIGDRPEDQEAAADAGVVFLPVNVFFTERPSERFFLVPVMVPDAQGRPREGYSLSDWPFHGTVTLFAQDVRRLYEGHAVDALPHTMSVEERFKTARLFAVKKLGDETMAYVASRHANMDDLTPETIAALTRFLEGAIRETRLRLSPDDDAP